MISFCTALELIKSSEFFREVISSEVSDALGAYLASDIKAPLDLPNFDNSAVDGYAVRTHEVVLGKNLILAKACRAVAQEYQELQEGRCIKIMTGAPIPTGADAVIMKEDAYENASHVNFSRAPSLGANIRKRGEDLTRNMLVGKAGQRVHAQLVGLLAGLGISKINIFKKPKLVIICTGDELVDAGRELKHGEVYFLVGHMLKAQAKEMGIDDIKIIRVGDDQDNIIAALQKAYEADLVLITGGMSKGEHDLVRPALKCAGVDEIFYQGLWRPGKPLYYGLRDKTYFFGLPGNPVACFVGFRIFVQTWLEAFFQNNNLTKLSYGFLKHNFSKAFDFTFFARADVQENSVEILGGQGSHQIFSLSKANALCLLPAGISEIKAQERVAYWPI